MTTYANWVADRVLLVEEHGLERGQSVLVDLPPHWLGPVFLGAAWSAGLVVVGPEEAPDAVVCGPDGLARWTPHAADIPVLACSLLPLGVRFAEPMPPDVHDVGVDVWSQPDSFTPWDPRPRTTRRPVRRTAAPPGRDVGDGRRRESPHRRRPPPSRRRTRLPHQDSPPSPAARTRRLAGPGRPRRTGTAQCGVHRRARHGPLPLSAARPGSPSLSPDTQPGHSARTLNRPGHRPSSLRPGTGGPRSRSACPVAATGRRWPATARPGRDGRPLCVTDPDHPVVRRQIDRSDFAEVRPPGRSRGTG